MSSVEAFTKGEGDVGDRVISGCSDTLVPAKNDHTKRQTGPSNSTVLKINLDKDVENFLGSVSRCFSATTHCFLATNYIHHGSPSPVHPDAGLRRLRHGMWHTCQPVNLTAYSFLTAEFTCALSRCAWLVSAHAFCAAPLRHTCRLHANLRVHLRLMQHLRTYPCADVVRIAPVCGRLVNFAAADLRRASPRSLPS